MTTESGHTLSPREQLRDRLVDAILTATRLLPSRRTGETRERPIPAEHLRVVLALLSLMDRDADRGLLDQHLITTNDLLSVLPPRKLGTTVSKTGERHEPAPALDTKAALASLDWLEREGLIAVDPLGHRRLGHRVRLTVDHASARTPAWPHARKLALDGIRRKRLSPAHIAILGHLAYEAGGDGSGRWLDVIEVEAITGLSWRWVLKQLRSGALGPTHGLASWNCRGRGQDSQLKVELCKPDDTEVATRPLARLHHRFIADALGHTSDAADEDDEVVGETEASASSDLPPSSESPQTTAPPKRSHKELRDEALRIHRLLWYRKLVDRAVELAEAHLPAGRRITLRRRINNFYNPVWELQEQYNNPNLIRYALEATLKSDALRKPDTRGWVKYLATVCKNAEHRFWGNGGPIPESNAEAAANQSIRARELAVRELLARAQELNDEDPVAARALLPDILSHAKDLAELCGGDTRLSENSLREAFKTGSSSFVGIRPSSVRYLVDHLPEWTWPHTDRSTDVEDEWFDDEASSSSSASGVRIDVPASGAKSAVAAQQLVCNEESASSNAGPAHASTTPRAAPSQERLKRRLRELLNEASEHNLWDKRVDAQASLRRMLGAIPKLVPALFEDAESAGPG